MGAPNQVINDPATTLEPQDKLWVQHCTDLIKDWADKIADATDGDTTVIYSYDHCKSIASLAGDMHKVLTGVELSRWHDEVPPVIVALEEQIKKERKPRN